MFRKGTLYQSQRESLVGRQWYGRRLNGTGGPLSVEPVRVIGGLSSVEGLSRKK